MAVKSAFQVICLLLTFGYFGICIIEAIPCFYNGKTYKEGDKWLESCQQTCTCDGGEIGLVRCYDHCLQWINLPPECQMKPPVLGKCCSEPSCPPSVKLPYPANYTSPDCPAYCNQGNGSQPAKDSASKTKGSTCLFNNKTYSVGETWIEDCQQSCTCVGGGMMMGYVSCRDLCLQWTGLPLACELKPPGPGKCCPEPSCPPYIQLQYPVGYTPPDCPASCSSKIAAKNKTVSSVGNKAFTCYHNNQTYNAGETWIENCNQSCTCDGSTGYINCHDLCLKWLSLPPVCRLGPPPPGKCCPEPICPPYVKLRYPPGYISPDCPASCSSGRMANYTMVSETVDMDSSCWYKNKTYKHGEYWIEDCQLNCTCEAGMKGFIKCHDLCLTWTNLPPVCKLNPPEQGKCCPEPSCPPDYQIQYPLGYIPPDCPASCKPKLI